MHHQTQNKHSLSIALGAEQAGKLRYTSESETIRGTWMIFCKTK